MHHQNLDLTLVDDIHGLLDKLKEQADSVAGEWNGDDPGELEDRARDANYITLVLIPDLKNIMEGLL